MLNIINGTNLNETLTGTDLADEINGFDGNDIIDGLAGDDILNGGHDQNTLTGGAGADIFSLATFEFFEFQRQIITDFENGTDLIDLSESGISSFDQIAGLLSQDGFNTRLDIAFDGQNQDIIIQNTLLSSITAANFIFDTATDGRNVNFGTDGSTFNVFGSLGNDFLIGGEGSDLILGGFGNDLIAGSFGENTLTGGDGVDTFLVSAFENFEFQRQIITDFDDGIERVDLSFTGISSFDQIEGFLSQDGFNARLDINYDGQSQDVIFEGISLGNITTADFIFDTLTNGRTVNLGSDGSSFNVFGSLGNDFLTGGEGADIILGGDGNDQISGSFGENTLTGGAGTDTFILSTFEDFEFQRQTITDFQDGVERVDLSAAGISNFEQLEGFFSQDGFNARLDLVHDGSSQDIVFEGINILDLTAEDFIFDTTTNGRTVDEGTDTSEFNIFGSMGNDSLTGGEGTDTIRGGDGNDLIAGNYGENSLTGGEGLDLFVFSAFENFEFQRQIITDFEDGIERVDLSAAGISSFDQIEAFLTQDGANARLDLAFNGRNNDLVFENFDLSDLGADDFAFDTFSSSRTLDFGTDSDDFSVFGSLDNDSLTGGTGDDDILGGFGNDFVSGSNGNDIVDGGAGDDMVLGGSGDDLLRGGEGLDVIDGGSGNDTNDFSTVDGGVGASIIAGTATHGSINETFSNIENLTGSNFNDTLIGDNFTNVLIGLNGADNLFGRSGNDILNGGDGNDTLNGNAGADMLSGDDGADILFGGGGDDVIDGGNDNDELTGQSGDDILNGGAGDDVITGNGGDDVINGGADNDNLNGGGGDDEIDGGSGDDILFGAIGVDEIAGGDGNDTINGGNQNDILNGDSGNDSLTGGGGNDSLNGGIGADTLIGGAGQDTLIGGAGNDSLLGSAGGDTLIGGNGNDTLFGGGGNDTLNGGSGIDTFVFTAAIGIDRVEGFQDGTDLIDLSGFVLADDFADVMSSATQFGANVRLDFNPNNSIIIENLNLADLDATDFIF